jgi:hypothetical protein
MSASRLSEIPGSPYRSLQELCEAISQRRAALSVDQSFSIQWIDLPGANPSRIETVFHFTMSWAMVWVGVAMAGLAWTSLGPKAILLVAVSLAAGMYCRPWRGQLTWFLALAFLIFSKGLLSWTGGAWLLTAFFVSGWISWCGDRLAERLLQNEPLLVWALQPRGTNPILERPVAVIKPGKNVSNPMDQQQQLEEYVNPDPFESPQDVVELDKAYQREKRRLASSEPNGPQSQPKHSR